MNARHAWSASSACPGIRRVCSSRAITHRPWGDRPGICETRRGPNGPWLTRSRPIRSARIWTGRLRGIVLSSRDHTPHRPTARQRPATSAPRDSDAAGRAEVDRFAALLGVTPADDTASGGHYIAAKTFGRITYQYVHIPACRAVHEAWASYSSSVIPDDNPEAA